MKSLALAWILFSAFFCFSQQPCPAEYHHEGEGAACFPDVSQPHKPPTSEPATRAIPGPAASAMPAAQSQAVIVFYRPSAFFGKALKPSVYVDGQEIGRLKNGNYLSFKTTSGPHTLASSKKDVTVPITLKPDETQYVEMVVQNGTWRGAGRLTPVSADEGKKRSQGLKTDQ